MLTFASITDCMKMLLEMLVGTTMGSWSDSARGSSTPEGRRFRGRGFRLPLESGRVVDLEDDDPPREYTGAARLCLVVEDDEYLDSDKLFSTTLHLSE